MQKNGVHAVPYTNGRLFDFLPKKGNDTTGRPLTCSESIAAWKADNADQFACGREGCPTCYQFYAEGYNQRMFAVMDPSTDYWQQKVANRTRTIAQTYGADGVYIDQVTATFPELCVQANKGGAGAQWTQGTRSLLERSIEAAGPEKLILSESNAEAYIGTVPGS